MYLHDMLYGSLEVNKFDIEHVIIYFFENLLFLLILISFVHYFGLPLRAILALICYDLPTFREVVLFWVRNASSLVSFL